MGNLFSSVGISLWILPYFPKFVTIIIIFGTSLLCSSILTILSTLVVSSRLRLIIWWSSIRLWLIIRWIVLSTIFPTTILFYYTKTVCLWNFYISANWWKFCCSTGDFLPCSLTFLEEYNALINENFLVVVVVGYI